MRKLVVVVLFMVGVMSFSEGIFSEELQILSPEIFGAITMWSPNRDEVYINAVSCAVLYSVSEPELFKYAINEYGEEIYLDRFLESVESLEVIPTWERGFNWIKISGIIMSRIEDLRYLEDEKRREEDERIKSIKLFYLLAQISPY